MSFKRFGRVLLVAFFSLFFVTSAQAQRRGGGEGGLINKLSGPGPFVSVSGFYSLSLQPFWPNVSGSLDASDASVWLNLTAGFAWSVGNDLDYAQGFDKSTTIKILTLGPSVDVKLTDKIGRLELGAGYGFHLFYGEAFPAFGRDSIDVRLGWRPWDRESYSGSLDILKFSIVGTYFPNGFTAEDFGAEPGTFEVGSDFVLGFVVAVDFKYQ